MNINVFEYNDYLKFLNDWCDQKRLKAANWSLGGFSKKLGLSNTAAVSNILKGRKVPSDVTITRLSEEMALNQREAKFLRALIEKRRHEKDSVLSIALNRFLSVIKPKKSQKEIEDDEFKIVSHPAFFVLREMVKLRNCTFSPEWFEKYIKYDFNLCDIKDGLVRLQEVGLLAKKEERFIQTVDYFETANNIPSAALREYHRKCLSFASDQLEKVDVSKRHITSDTIAINVKQLNQIKELLESFRNELTSSFDVEEADQIYHFNMQLVPATDQIDE